MSELPLISVVTPTWQRHWALLERCIPSVRAQDYAGPIEQIIVSGPDPGLSNAVSVLAVDAPANRSLLYTEIDPNVADGGATPRRVGCERARGSVLAYLDDDNAYRPQHVRLLFEALVRNGADFVYSQMLRHRPESEGLKDVIGSSVPGYGHIDTSLIMNHRRLLELATWEKVWNWDDGRCDQPDWDLVQRWLQAGASWAHVPMITLDYYFSR